MKRFLHAGERYARFATLNPTSIYNKSTPNDNFGDQMLSGAASLFKVTRAMALVALICLGFSLNLSAQKRAVSKKAPTYYQIGDKLPKKLVLGTLLNDSLQSVSLGDYRGKAVILDFWATYCGTCIANFPKVDSIAKANKNNLKVLLVHISPNREKKETVQHFLTQYEAKYPEFDQPIVMVDLQTKTKFLVPSIPHYIWVDANGRIQAITNGDALTAQNMENFIAGRTLQIKKKIR